MNPEETKDVTPEEVVVDTGVAETATVEEVVEATPEEVTPEPTV